VPRRGIEFTENLVLETTVPGFIESLVQPFPEGLLSLRDLTHR
jgi:hypothetical protein